MGKIFSLDNLNPKLSVLEFKKNILKMMYSDPQKAMKVIKQFIANCDNNTVKVRYKSQNISDTKRVVNFDNLNYQKAYTRIFESILKEMDRVVLH